MDVRSLALVLFLTALAGCLGAGDADPVGTVASPSPTSAATSTTTTTSTTAAPALPPENRPPLLELSSDEATHVLGEDFTFHLAASDRDGDALTWSFDADVDGSPEASGDDGDLPADVTFGYDTLGDHTATFTADDGQHSVDASLTVTVTEVPFQDFTATFEGTATGLVGPDGAYVQGGSAFHALAVPAGAGRISVALAWGDGGVDLDLRLLSPSGKEVARSGELNAPDGAPVGRPGEALLFDPGHPVPVGDYSIEVVAYTAYEAFYTVTADVVKDTAQVVRVFSGTAPPAASADAIACLLAHPVDGDDVLGLDGRPYAIEPAGLYVVFSGEDLVPQGDTGAVPAGSEFAYVCADPPAAPGPYTLTIG